MWELCYSRRCTATHTGRLQTELSIGEAGARMESPADKARAMAQRDASCSTRQEYLFEIRSHRVAEALTDARDAPAAFLVANVFVLTVPAAVAVLACCTSHVVGCAYVVCRLHTNEHKLLSSCVLACTGGAAMGHM